MTSIKENLIVMGYKTAASIPCPKFFPFKDTRKVVVMTTKDPSQDEMIQKWKAEAPEKIAIAKDYESLFEIITENAFEIGDIWICGGSKIYDDFIQNGSVLDGKLFVKEIYETVVDCELECDAFIQPIPEKLYKSELFQTFEKTETQFGAKVLKYVPK